MLAPHDVDPEDRTDETPEETLTPTTPSVADEAEPEEPGRFKGIKRWARQNSPGLHQFLVSEERPFPLMRELSLGAFVILLAVALLWGGTGQKFGDSPVVVIESGSMMHCDQGRSTVHSSQCEGPYARLGTIDPGDLVFVKDVDSRSDVNTFASQAKCDVTDFDQFSCACKQDSYGRCGDVIIYRPGGSNQAVPIIHRAMFWLEIHGNGTYSVPECGLIEVPRAGLNNVCLSNMHARNLNNAHYLDDLGPESSGFVTLGDNNAGADLPNINPAPVRPDWILGKARGEIPWVGLVKLWVSDLFNGCQGDPRIPCNFDNAPGDVKTMMVVTIGTLVASPFIVEKVQNYRAGRRDEEGGNGGEGGDEGTSL